MGMPENKNARELIKTGLKKRTTIIKNPLAFRLEYDPHDLFVRNEIEYLIKDVLDYVNYKSPGNLLLLGTPGTGKTASLRFIEKTLNDSKAKEEFVIKYINCRDKSAFDIISELTGNEKTNISTKLLYKRFFSEMEKNHLIFLDEIDKGSDPKEISNLLYILSRPLEYSEEIKYTINMVLASNNLNWSNKIDPALRSSLSLKEYVFSPYNITQLIEIMKRRIKEGVIKDCLNQDTLRHIARKVIEKHNGDSRYAIRILFYSIREIELKGDGKISQSIVNLVFPNVEKEIESAGMQKLSDNHFFTLYASSTSKIDKTMSIYETYGSVISNFGMRFAKFNNFHHYLQYLENQNLIRMIKKEGERELSVEVLAPKESIKQEFVYRTKKLQLYKKQGKEEFQSNKNIQRKFGEVLSTPSNK